MNPDQPSLPGSTVLAGPFVGVAVFCEKVLREADGVLTLVRVVDRITFQIQASTPEPPAYPLYAVVMLKAGDARGTFDVSIRSEGPSGQDLGTVKAPLLFEGFDRGVNLILQLPFQPAEEGLHWFEVAVDQQVLTRIPLRAVYQRISITGGRT
ncbi:MAG: hypothetical protein H0X67_02435 [Acidobacteria bacterium]|nr:hypothetical protein [Acidobacteriota bacterium]